MFAATKPSCEYLTDVQPQISQQHGIGEGGGALNATCAALETPSSSHRQDVKGAHQSAQVSVTGTTKDQ